MFLQALRLLQLDDGAFPPAQTPDDAIPVPASPPAPSSPSPQAAAPQDSPAAQQSQSSPATPAKPVLVILPPGPAGAAAAPGDSPPGGDGSTVAVMRYAPVMPQLSAEEGTGADAAVKAVETTSPMPEAIGMFRPQGGASPLTCNISQLVSAGS